MEALPQIADFADKEQIEQIEDYLLLKDAIWNDWPLIYEVLLDHRVKFFHREWVDFQLNNKRTILLGPRGFGKTQGCTKDYSILKSLGSRDERILILGKTLPQARSILREVRLQLERNELIQLFGSFFESKSEKTEKTQTELFFTGRTKTYSEPNIGALGIGGTIVAGHYSIIIADDLVDRRNSMGRASEETYNYVKEEVIPMLLPGGEFHIIGSPYAEKDPIQRMIKEGLGGETDFKVMQYSCFDGNVSPSWPDGESIWPEWISTKSLYQRRLPGNMGEAFFRAQYMCDVSLLERTRRQFFKEDCQCRKRSEVFRHVEQIIIGVDPSTGEGKSWTGIVVLGVVKPDPDWPRFWIMDLFKEKFGSSETKQLLKRLFNNKYKDAEVIVVEAVGYQKDLANELSKELPIEERIPVGSKRSRISRVGNLFQQGAVGYCQECEELMEDFWDYQDERDPNDLHDAFDDAWSFALAEDEETDYENVDVRTEFEKRDDLYRKRREERYGRVSRGYAVV